MDPRKVAEIHNAMNNAMNELMMEYVLLMKRLGVKNFPVYAI